MITNKQIEEWFSTIDISDFDGIQAKRVYSMAEIAYKAGMHDGIKQAEAAKAIELMVERQLTKVELDAWYEQDACPHCGVNDMPITVSECLRHSKVRWTEYECKNCASRFEIGKDREHLTIINNAHLRIENKNDT